MKFIENLPWHRVNALTGKQRFEVWFWSTIVLTLAMFFGFWDTLMSSPSNLTYVAQIIVIEAVSVIYGFSIAIPVVEYSVHGLNLAAARARRIRNQRIQENE